MEASPAEVRRLCAALEDEGLIVQLDPPLDADRGVDPVVAWVGFYVLEKVVDASLGRPVERTLARTVDAVVRRFRALYPNLTIRIED